MANMKTLKHFKNLLRKAINEIKQYVKKIRLLNLINDFEHVFPMGSVIK